MEKKKSNIVKLDPEKWVVIENVKEKNGKTTNHFEEAGFRFQLKQLEFWRSVFKEKYGHNVVIVYTEVK